MKTIILLNIVLCVIVTPASAQERAGSGMRLTPDDFELIGGFRVPQEFAQGGLAIDFENRKLYSGGARKKGQVHEYELPEMGEGKDLDAWPVVKRTRTFKRFWGEGYAGGLDLRDGKLWVSPRVFYDTSPGKLVLFGKDLETGEVTEKQTGLRQPAFGGGFIEGHPDLWLIGCGGYMSGQGSVAGPTAATAEGRVLLNQANHGTLDWNRREKRPANYSVPKDSWVGLKPRDGEGRWASDHIYGGGVWRPRGLCFWPVLGTGELDYSTQSEAFADGSVETWLYTYDPETYDDVQYTKWPYGAVHGHEVGPDGLVYLLVRKQWKVGVYKTGSVVKVFRLKQ